MQIQQSDLSHYLYEMQIPICRPNQKQDHGPSSATSERH